MIYLCQNCGWRIKERYNKEIKPENVGKYLIYSNKPFCSERCIEYAKKRPYILIRDVKPSDWDEIGDKNWKVMRKINRKRPIRK
jgi:hypothetical protein